MGCSSSRGVEVQNSRKLLRPELQQNNPHLVALTSSSYGFLNLDSQKHSDEANDADPVNQMYQQMMSLDAPGSELPQSWSEVSNALSKLKTAAQNKDKAAGPGKAQVKSVPQAIDISDLLKDAEEEQLEDEKPIAKGAAKRRPVSEIRTLEEVDRMASVTEESSSDHDEFENGGFPQAPTYYDSPKKPATKSSRAAENGPKPDKRYSMSSVSSRSRSTVAETKASKSISTEIIDTHKSESTLFDPEFLASFQEAFEKLSSGVPSSQPTDRNPAPKRNKVPQLEAGKELPVQRGPLKSRNAANEVFQLPATRENHQYPRVSPPNTQQASRAGPQKMLPAPKKRVEDPLMKFEKRCPPDGEQRVVLYSTSLRGIRKTFEDCNTVRSIIQSFNIEFDERDVSLDSAFRQELKDLMEKPVPVPRLFVKGRYLGGPEEVLRLHESGTLAKLLEGLPSGNLSKDCDGCGGVRFIPCTDCNGSRKVVAQDGSIIKCPDCNENGLARCPICS